MATEMRESLRRVLRRPGSYLLAAVTPTAAAAMACAALRGAPGTRS